MALQRVSALYLLYQGRHSVNYWTVHVDCIYSTWWYLFYGCCWSIVVLHPESSYCFLPSDANKGPAAQRGGGVLSVSPQQAAVVLELGACFNYCIISPPTLSLTTGENEGSVQFRTLNVNMRSVLHPETIKSIWRIADTLLWITLTLR